MARRQARARAGSPARPLAPIKEKLALALSTAVNELADAGVPFALVGGLAMAVRAEPRVTRDIDFVVPARDDDEAEARIFALQRRGFRVESVFVRKGNRISTVRTRHRVAPEILIDFLFSNARIEPEIVAAASPEAVTTQVRCPVAQPWHLLAMKVYANRPKDQPDLQDLLERASARLIGRAAAALRLMMRRGVGEGRDLVAELEQHVRAVRLARAETKASGARVRRILRRNRVRASRPART